jgi:hypothetical protein
MITVVGKIFTFNTFTSSEGDYSNVTNLVSHFIGSNIGVCLLEHP